MHQFKELKIWQKAIDLTVDLYNQSKNDISITSNA